MKFSPSLLSPFFVCSYLSLTARAANVANQAQSLFQPSFNDSFLLVQNKSITSDPVDERFSILAGYSQVKINTQSCLLNAVDVLARLAAKDYYDRFEGYDDAVLFKHPEVTINIKPAPPADDIPVRIAVWGVYYSIYDMINKKKFVEAEIDLLWSGSLIGWVRYQPTTPSKSIIQGQVNKTLNLTKPSVTFTNRSESTLDLNTTPGTELLDLELYYIVQGKPLTMIEIFVSVYATLKNIAPFPKTDDVESFSAGAAAFDARVYFADGPTRTLPPFYEYRWVIQAMQQVPEYMLSHKRFSELAIVLIVDDVFVGQGVLAKGAPRNGNSGPNSSLIVSETT